MGQKADRAGRSRTTKDRLGHENPEDAGLGMKQDEPGPDGKELVMNYDRIG